MNCKGNANHKLTYTDLKEGIVLNQRASKQTGKTSKIIHTNPIHRQTSTINFSHHTDLRHTERPSSSKQMRDHYICPKTVAMITGCILCVGRYPQRKFPESQLTCTQTLIQFLTFKRTQTTLGLTLQDNSNDLYNGLSEYMILIGWKDVQ